MALSAQQHRNARATLLEAFKRRGIKPTPARLQYVQGFTLGESSYGLAWAKDGPAGAGSHNWGAVMCKGPGPDCFPHKDSNPDGSQFPAYFVIYPDDVSGAADAVRHALELRPKVGSELSRSKPSVMRSSYAMRRERYYGGFCPKATAKYGAEAARASFAEPDRDEGTSACAQEAIEGHARGVWNNIQTIAAANDEPVALELGTYKDADDWWHGVGRRGWGVFAGLATAAACGGGLWFLITRHGA